MGSCYVCVWCLLFVGCYGLSFRENWDIDYNRLEIHQTDSQPSFPPQITYTRIPHHNSRRSYRHRPAYYGDRSGGARENNAVRRTDRQNDTNTGLIYKAREDPSLFYKRDNSHNHSHKHNKDENEYAHDETTLLKRKYDTFPKNKQHYDIQTNSIYKARQDPSLFYKRNNSYHHSHKRNNNEYEYAQEKTTLLQREHDTFPQNKQNDDHPIQTNSIYTHRQDPKLFNQSNNRLDSNNRSNQIDSRPGNNANSNDVGILGPHSARYKPLREFRQIGRAVVRNGETVHVGPDPNFKRHENIPFNTPEKIHPSSRSHNIAEAQSEMNNVIENNLVHQKRVEDDRIMEPDTLNNGMIRPCIMCPFERTVIGEIGQDGVILLKPQLKTCRGDNPGPAVHFKRKYGPYFGALLREGSHIVVASVTYHGEEIQLCQFRVHVVLRHCPTPRGITVQCDAPQVHVPPQHVSLDRVTPSEVTRDAAADTWCNFTCQDATKQMVGSSTLVCGNDLQWKGTPPHCKVKTWCSRPVEPKYGRLVCSGQALTNVAFAHGSRCRARCSPGRVSRPAHAICRRGKWTATLRCEPAT